MRFENQVKLKGTVYVDEICQTTVTHCKNNKNKAHSRILRQLHAIFSRVAKVALSIISLSSSLDSLLLVLGFQKVRFVVNKIGGPQDK